MTRTTRLNDTLRSTLPPRDKIRQRSLQVNQHWSDRERLLRAGFRKGGFMTPEERLLAAIFPARLLARRRDSAA